MHVMVVMEGVRTGTLTLVGIGLFDEMSISLRGLEAVEEADFVFAEDYTSALEEGAVKRLAERTGKDIVMLGRDDVEDAGRIVEACSSAKVVLLVVGDPLTATTHIDLRLRAEEASVETRIVHGASVMTAVPGLLGLQHYKFGRSTTVPFPQEGYLPTSPYEIVLENMSRGLHTLVLLDIDAEGRRYMTAQEGLQVLLEMGRKLGDSKIDESTLVCAVARAGSQDCVVAACSLGEMKARNLGPPLHTVVVPAGLHFMEEEGLRRFAGWRSTPTR